LGHPAGDECLRAIAAALASVARRAGDVVARYGGEEFAFLIPACQLAEAQQYGESLCAAVRALNIDHPDASVTGSVTISVGMTASVPLQGTTVHDVLSAADKALYAAKKAGRDRCCVALPVYDFSVVRGSS
jgi:diguanylate cyclase (GGDEF)-like protein